LSGADEHTPGRVVSGRYRLERVLGRGGMGTVWLAVDTLIERQVALKELRAPAGASEGDESSFVERAMREARNAGRLNHPGVVAVHDVIAPVGDDDAVYLVMEYVPAPTLADLIDDEGKLPAARVAAMGLGIVDALMAAHTMGIVHRDIKPGNVLVREGDRIKLTDFGIALAAEDTRLTRTGVVGTHAYLAPESFDTGNTGPAADLWALGATLFHAVAGKPPFERATTTESLRAILFEDPPPPPCEPRLAEVITGLLTRSVDQRLSSDVARQKLEAIVAEPAPADASPADAGPSTWDSHATTVHPRPQAPVIGQTTQPGAGTWGQTTQPGSHPWGQTTQPGGPSPYTTSQPGAAPGQGGYGYGPGPGAPPAASQVQRSNNLPWIIGGVAVVAVLLVVVIVAASGGGGGGGAAASSPADAVRGFVGAVIDGDCEGAVEYVSQDFPQTCPENPEDVGFSSLVDVETVSEEGGTAVVQATIADSSGQEVQIPFELVQEDGEWRVDDIQDIGAGTSASTIPSG
jgi:serine/threonine protein kinase